MKAKVRSNPNLDAMFAALDKKIAEVEENTNQQLKRSEALGAAVRGSAEGVRKAARTVSGHFAAVRKEAEKADTLPESGERLSNPKIEEE